MIDGKAISPQEIRFVRESLGMSSSQFAAVLGVHPTTVSRWENSKKAVVPVEGMAQNVLAGLIRRIENENQAKRTKAAGQEIANALVFAGVLVAIAMLARYAAGEDER